MSKGIYARYSALNQQLSRKIEDKNTKLEQGMRERLLEQKGRYYRLHQRQVRRG
jgi:hypothetical protein